MSDETGLWVTCQCGQRYTAHMHTVCPSCGLWLPKAEICGCGNMICLVPNTKSAFQYYADGDGRVCVDNHWHAPVARPAAEGSA